MIIIPANIAVNTMWIHEHHNWPDFSWNTERLASKLAEIRYRQGLLLGRMEMLSFELKNEASLNTLTNDIVKSSAIEGEILNPEEVRSSIASRLGLDAARLVSVNRAVDGFVEMMLDATQKFTAPLTKERLFDWHAALFPTGQVLYVVLQSGDGAPHNPVQCRLFPVRSVVKKCILNPQMLNVLKMR